MIKMIGGWLESAIHAAPESSRTIVAIQVRRRCSRGQAGPACSLCHRVRWGGTPLLNGTRTRRMSILPACLPADPAVGVCHPVWRD